MNALNSDQTFSILTLILNENQCHRTVHILKEENVNVEMVNIGMGTVKSAALKLFGIKSQKKIVINCLVEKSEVNRILNLLIKELQLNHLGHGLVYTTDALTTNHIINCKKEALDVTQNTEADNMYKKLTVIVNRGIAEDVMDIARKAGVTGGTILHGRGTTSELAVTLMGMEIEPEKELVMMLMPSELVDTVVKNIYAELQFDLPGKGIMFVEPVSNVHGLFDSESEPEN